MVNNKAVARDTEPNLVFAPSDFWTTKARKLPQNKSFRVDDTTVVVSATDRTDRNLVKRFHNLDIDWTILEKQLQTWSYLFCIGMKLRIDISFNYMETGDASIRRDVYNIMRCPGPLYHIGPHYWRNNVGKKHYQLKTHYLKRPIKHVEEGERQRKHKASSLASCPPINITNVLPPQASTMYLIASTPGSSAHLEISGPLDFAVKRYSSWQYSQKACNLTLAEGLDLELVYKDRNSEFYIKKAVKSSVARRFFRDIETWAKKCNTLLSQFFNKKPSMPKMPLGTWLP
ncbi:hypothetical protein V2W45_1468721 [Cenococcum geophilum]